MVVLGAVLLRSRQMRTGSCRWARFLFAARGVDFGALRRRLRVGKALNVLVLDIGEIS